MLTGHCHCGAVVFRALIQPDALLVCNCSICRRLGARWIYAPVADVTFDMQSDATLSYIREAGNLAFHTCRTCGCTTHWAMVSRNPDAENTSTTARDRVALNANLCPPEHVAALPVRHFDGADTWQFLD